MERAKAFLIEKFTEIQAHSKKYEKSQINNLNDHLNELKTTTTTTKALSQEKEGNNKDHGENEIKWRQTNRKDK